VEDEVKSPPINNQTAEMRAAVDDCYEWLEDDKQAKDFYVREMDENDKQKLSKHWDLLGPDGNVLRTEAQQAVRPNAVENVSFALVAGTVSEFATRPELADFPQEPSDELVATMMSDLKKHIGDKNRLEEELLKFHWNFFGHGTGIFETVWDPTWRGGKGPNKWVGECRWRSVHPRAFFADARCGEDIHQGRRVHKVRYVPLEYLREKYPEHGALASEDALNVEYITNEDTQNSEVTQKDRALLVETWYIGEPKVKSDDDKGGSGLHVIWWSGDANPVYLAHANYVYYDPDEDPRFPFVVRQRYPRDGSWCGIGEFYYLRQVQIIHNKTIEILLEGHVHAALGQGFFNEDALNEKQKKALREKGTLPGMWFGVNDINNIKRVYGQSMPSSLLQEANRLPKMMEQIIGRFDIAQGRNPGSITAFRALDLMAQRAQVRLRSADLAITSAYQEVGENLNRLIYENYTERRAYRIIAPDEQQKLIVQRRGVFKPSDAKRVYMVGSGEVMPYEGFVPGVTDAGEAMQEGTDYEVYCPEMDVRCKTSTEMPSDRLFYMEMAKELYGIKVIDAETFFYVIDKGRFPPWSEVGQRLAEREHLMMMQDAGAPKLPTGGGGGGTGVAGLNMPPELMAQLDALDPDTKDRVASGLEALPPDQQAQFVEEAIRQSQAQF